jgi:hypothetical protein
MLSPLQLRVARIVAGLAEADGFALAGGGALIVRGDTDRRTRDLDFFGPSPDAVDQLLPAVERALVRDGLGVDRVRVAPGFARLAITRDGERTELDLGADARLFPPDPGEPAPTLTSLELAVDKVLAIFGRAEARDFADLMVLSLRYPLERLFVLAREKDRGFEIKYFVEMLARFHRLRREEFDLDDKSYEVLRQTVDVWHVTATELERQGAGEGTDRD